MTTTDVVVRLVRPEDAVAFQANCFPMNTVEELREYGRLPRGLAQSWGRVRVFDPAVARASPSETKVEHVIPSVRRYVPVRGPNPGDEQAVNRHLEAETLVILSKSTEYLIDGTLFHELNRRPITKHWHRRGKEQREPVGGVHGEAQPDDLLNPCQLNAQALAGRQAA